MCVGSSPTWGTMDDVYRKLICVGDPVLVMYGEYGVKESVRYLDEKYIYFGISKALIKDLNFNMGIMRVDRLLVELDLMTDDYRQD